MLTQVEVRTSQGGLLSLPLEDISSGFVVKNIDGLGPVKATIVSSSFAQMDGSQYHSSSRGDRNMIFTIELEPDWATATVRDLRNRLYSFFMPKSEVNLRFYDSDGLAVDAVGRVESCEPTIFAKEPSVDISIICFDPDFIDVLQPVAISGLTTSTTTPALVNYLGSTETGIQFVLSLNRALTQFSIYHTPPDGSLRQLDFAASLLFGDTVTINTIKGSKSAILTRGGSNSSILYGISPQSNWIELAPGLNKIRIFAAGAGIPYRITYTDRYGGL